MKFVFIKFICILCLICLFIDGTSAHAAVTLSCSYTRTSTNGNSTRSRDLTNVIVIDGNRWYGKEERKWFDIYNITADKYFLLKNFTINRRTGDWTYSDVIAGFILYEIGTCNKADDFDPDAQKF